ncbi:hypothetical protein [Alkalihalobacillus sp. CinArs1]|uniref:hypothetical protein n=1 Tax=Alkalihalobacillus sp. CinArs1 TaxID=2995314 RepID=UPI0022DE1E27|nr:hypothetical protein [Alkalihalobacillus sp. CinArs1]
MRRVSVLGKINLVLGLVFLTVGISLVFLDGSRSLIIAFAALGLALILSSLFLNKSLVKKGSNEISK